MKAIFTPFVLFLTSSLYAQQYYQVTADVLNVRTSASGNAEVISKLKLGDSVYIIGNSSGWSKAKLQGDNYGYVSSKFISKDFKTSAAGKKEEETSVLGSFAVLAFMCLAWFFSRSSKGNASSSGRSPLQPIFWFGCERCGHTIRQGSTPSQSGCPTHKHKEHRWHKVAELGETNYQCERCGTHVYAKSRPSTSGCPTHEYKEHRWHKL